MIRQILAMLTGRKYATIQSREHEVDADVVAQLQRHPVFQELQSYRGIGVNNIRVTDEVKRRMAIKFLQIFYSCMESTLADITNHYPEYCKNSFRLSQRLVSTINDAKDQSLANGIPTVFIDRYTPRLTTNISVLTTILTEVSQNGTYSTQKDQMCAELDVTLTFIKFCMDAAEGIIEHMNGELHMALVGSIFDN